MSVREKVLRFLLSETTSIMIEKQDNFEGTLKKKKFCK